MPHKHDSTQTLYKSFPDLDVEIKAKVILSRGPDHIYADRAHLSSTGLFVSSEKGWPLGALVDVEFTLDGDLNPYRGEGRVSRVVHGMRDAFEGGVAVEFTRLSHKNLRFHEHVREWDRSRRIGTQILLDALEYARQELRGNTLPEKDFGQPGAGHRRPVLLIHGFMGTRGAVLLLEQRLKSVGFPVFSVSLGAVNLDDIKKSARKIADKIAELDNRLLTGRIDILCHSMGGLIALYYIKHLGGAEQVRRMISIGSPYGGAPLALASLIFLPWTGLIGKAVWQLLPGSYFLKELHKGPLPKNVDIVSLIAKEDNVVSPSRCVLDGARNIMIATSHAGLVVSQKSFTVIEELLAES